VTRNDQQSKDHCVLKSCAWTASVCVFLLLAVCNLLAGQEKSSAGATTFKSKCILCHGPDGSGNTPLGKQLQAANLGSKDVQKLSNAELRKVVHDGRANMPAFADQLSTEEIDQVIQFVRQFGKSAKKKSFR